MKVVTQVSMTISIESGKAKINLALNVTGKKKKLHRIESIDFFYRFT